MAYVIEVEAKKFLSFLNRFDRMLYNKNIFDYIARSSVDRTKQRFQTKQDPNGNTWKSNAPATIARKGRNDPLVDTGRLSKSIEYSILDDGFVVGTDVPYGRANQEGTDKIPARPFLGFEISEIEAGVDYIMKEIMRI